MYHKVLVPLDGSKLAECVLPHLNIIADSSGLRTVIFFRAVRPFYPVAVGDSFSGLDVGSVDKDEMAAAEDYLQNMAGSVSWPGVTVGWEVVLGNEADSIVDYAKNSEVDLIVLATHGRSGISRWVMGSVADRVLHSACVPVLTIRAPGCVPGI